MPSMGIGKDLVDLGVIAGIGAVVLWIVLPSRRKKKTPTTNARAGVAAWDPDTDAGRRKR